MNPFSKIEKLNYGDIIQVQRNNTYINEKFIKYTYCMYKDTYGLDKFCKNCFGRIITNNTNKEGECLYNSKKIILYKLIVKAKLNKKYLINI